MGLGWAKANTLLWDNLKIYKQSKLDQQLVFLAYL